VSLFSDQVINVKQMVKLALEFGIPSSFRVTAWRLMSGIYPTYRSLIDFTMQEKEQIYSDINEAAQVLDVDPDLMDQLCNVIRKGSDGQSMVDEKCWQLVQLHQIYWCTILCELPLRGMDDRRFLCALARIIRSVLEEEMEQFWCFVKFLELLDRGLQMFDPLMTLDAFYDMNAGDFENILLHILDTGELQK
jgi:hypothetical protein